MGTVSQLATAVEDDEVVFRLSDTEHEYADVKVWFDVDLGVELAMAEVEDGWELRLALPDLDCLEYLFDVDGTLVPDPGNPDRVEGAFGPHSWLAMPGYQPPGWLDADSAPGSRHELTVGEIGVEVWEPAGHEGAPLPLLLVHDGAEMDAYGGVVRYAATRPPMRVGLLAPGSDRDARYAANPAYAAALVDEVLPAITDAFETTRPAGAARPEPRRARGPARGVDRAGHLRGADAPVRLVLHPGARPAGVGLRVLRSGDRFCRDRAGGPPGGARGPGGDDDLRDRGGELRQQPRHARPPERRRDERLVGRGPAGPHVDLLARQPAPAPRATCWPGPGASGPHRGSVCAARTHGTHLAALPSLDDGPTASSLRRLAIHPTESLAALAIPRDPGKACTHPEHAQHAWNPDGGH